MFFMAPISMIKLLEGHDANICGVLIAADRCRPEFLWPCEIICYGQKNMMNRIYIYDLDCLTIYIYISNMYTYIYIYYDLEVAVLFFVSYI